MYSRSCHVSVWALRKDPKVTEFSFEFIDRHKRHDVNCVIHQRKFNNQVCNNTYRHILLFTCALLRRARVFTDWSPSTVMNAKSTRWTDESASSNTCSPLYLSEESSLTSKQHSQEFPVGSAVPCRQTQATHWVLHSWATSHVCMHTWRYTHMAYSQQTRSQRTDELLTTLPQALLYNIQSYSALYRSGSVCVICWKLVPSWNILCGWFNEIK